MKTPKLSEKEQIYNSIVENILQKCQSTSVREMNRGTPRKLDTYFSMEGIVDVLKHFLLNKKA